MLIEMWDQHQIAEIDAKPACLTIITEYMLGGVDSNLKWNFAASRGLNQISIKENKDQFETNLVYGLFVCLFFLL